MSRTIMYESFVLRCAAIRGSVELHPVAAAGPETGTADRFLISAMDHRGEFETWVYSTSQDNAIDSLRRDIDRNIRHRKQRESGERS